MLVLEKAAEDASYTFLSAMVNTLGTGVGYLVAMVLFAGVRERLEDADIPKTLKGLPITLISAAIVALSFLGFAGIVDGLQ
jgi:electron transport complex protein RnfA